LVHSKGKRLVPSVRALNGMRPAPTRWLRAGPHVRFRL
jgi:hypothetical protein